MAGFALSDEMVAFVVMMCWRLSCELWLIECNLWVSRCYDLLRYDDYCYGPTLQPLLVSPSCCSTITRHVWPGEVTTACDIWVVRRKILAVHSRVAPFCFRGHGIRFSSTCHIWCELCRCLDVWDLLGCILKSDVFL